MGKSLPNFEVGLKICNHFHISPKWLLFGEGPMQLAEADTSASLVAEVNQSSDIEAELIREREMNRDLVVENRQLWKENGELKVRVGELNVQVVKLEGELDTARTMAKEYHEELKAARAAPEDKNSDDLRHSA